LGSKAVFIPVVVAAAFVASLVVKIDDEPDALAEKVVVTGLSALEDPLHGPAKIIGDIQQWLLLVVLDIEDDAAKSVLGLNLMDRAALGLF
jgi:hypothetical protein